MRRIALLLLLLGACQIQRTPWPPAPGPLMTRWAKDVAPETVHPEYPRPQMVRREWMSLNGLWETEFGRALVPFPIESALSGIMKHADRVTYRRSFDVPSSWKRILLHFGAVDWEATVHLDGHALGTHRGGYDEFSFEIENAPGRHDLVVEVFDPTDKGDQPRGKQVVRPEGIYYTPSTGIWQTVWIEPVPDRFIRSLDISPDLDAKCVRVRVNAGVDMPVQVNGIKGRIDEEIVVPVPHPHPWTPGDPYLYELRARAGEDEVTSYFGMRKVEVKDGRIRLNGEPILQVGTLDQGFWPDGLYTAPTDEALRYDIEITKKLGFNMIRKHVKVEPERWYYWADKLGILVWQDMPSGYNRSVDSKKQFESELRRMIEGRRNHPSIIMWIVFNEGWGQYDTERLTRWVKDLDPARLVNDASGWTDKRVGDISDMHHYTTPDSPNPEAGRAVVLGEFGGVSLAVAAHTWTQKTWGYQGAADSERLTRKLVSFFRRVWELMEEKRLSAAVYTQITDVETECNGLLTYDRAVVKVDIDRLSAAVQGRAPKVQVGVPILQKWRYTFERPAADWMNPAFDDSKWKEGQAGFGTVGTPGAIVHTEWKTDDIWIRREMDVPQGKLTLLVHHDEDVEIYFNGVLSAQAPGYITDYEELDFTAPPKPGKNLVAAHCHQTVGGQYIDIGILRD